MTRLKQFFNRLFPVRQSSMPPQKVRGDVIRCHDCAQLGYIAYYRDGTYTMPPGWKMGWVGFKPLYICGDCVSCCRSSGYFK